MSGLVSSEPRVAVIVGASKPELAAALAAHVAAASAAAVAARGRFAIALSGGSMPALLGALAAEPHLSAVAWDRWDVLFADERCVPADDADSNFKAVDDALLKALAPRGLARVHTLDGALLAAGDDAALARDYEAKLLAATGGTGCLDLALLGIGPDGHTCSLFPGHALVAAPPPPPAAGPAPPHALVAAIADSPKPPPRRVTLTLSALQRARACAFVGTGGGKAPILAQAFETALGPEPAADRDGADAAPAAYYRYREPPALPVGMVRPASGAIVWFVDADAASGLPT